MEYRITEKEMKELPAKNPWQIHMVIDKDDQHQLKQHRTDAHTHGLALYLGTELQFTLRLQPGLVGYIINTIGRICMNYHYSFRNGDRLYGIFENKDLYVEFHDATDSYGEPILRICVPDDKLKLGKDAEYPYSEQDTDPYEEVG